MKKIIFAALMCGFTISSFAQDITTTITTTDSTKTNKGVITTRRAMTINLGGKKHSDTVTSSFGFGFDFGFDFGWTRFIDDGNPASVTAVKDLSLEKGPNFGLNLIGGHVKLTKNGGLRLKTALGLDYNGYHFRKGITLMPDQDQLTYTIDPSSNFNKNLLRTTYLRLPVLLAVRPEKKSSFEIAAGAEIGALIWGKTKQVSDDLGKVKVKDTFNLNPYRYGLIFRLGYQNFNIYTKYYLNDVFAKNQGPAGLSNISFGLSFGGI